MTFFMTYYDGLESIEPMLIMCNCIRPIEIRVIIVSNMENKNPPEYAPLVILPIKRPASQA